MNAPAIVRADPEVAVRDWLRSLHLTDLDGSVFLAAPRSNTYPRAQVTLIASTDDEYIDPLGEDEVQIDVLATTRAQASSIARAVIGNVKSIIDGTPFGSTAICKGGRVLLGPLPRHELERVSDGKSRPVYRFLVSARFSLIPSA